MSLPKALERLTPRNSFNRSDDSEEYLVKENDDDSDSNTQVVPNHYDQIDPSRMENIDKPVREQPPLPERKKKDDLHERKKQLMHELSDMAEADRNNHEEPRNLTFVPGPTQNPAQTPDPDIPIKVDSADQEMLMRFLDVPK